jgi:hypothetical protein
MELDVLNISNADQLQVKLGETRIVSAGDAISTALAVLSTWPLWRYVVTTILGVILYDQST